MYTSAMNYLTPVHLQLKELLESLESLHNGIFAITLKCHIFKRTKIYEAPLSDDF